MAMVELTLSPRRARRQRPTCRSDSITASLEGMERSHRPACGRRSDRSLARVSDVAWTCRRTPAATSTCRVSRCCSLVVAPSLYALKKSCMVDMFGKLSSRIGTPLRSMYCRQCIRAWTMGSWAGLGACAMRRARDGAYEATADQYAIGCCKQTDRWPRPPRRIGS